jgi:hypothetical protein
VGGGVRGRGGLGGGGPGGGGLPGPAGSPSPPVVACHARKARTDGEASGQQAALLRDLFGHPFHPAALNPAWLTPEVRTLAQAAHEERALRAGTLPPARLAVLAGALEEAGCDNAEVLGHLPGEGPHVRGCWALDWLLERE